MEITWYGHACFRIAERGLATVVTDPYNSQETGFAPLKLKADIVTVSRNLPGHNFVSGVKNDTYIIDGPGEYEIGGVFITAIVTNGTSARSNDPQNMLCVIDFEGLTVAHLGALKRVPSQTQVEALGPVHVALVPVGGGGGLNAAKASEVISLLEPNIVVPMHYAIPGSKMKLDPLSRFLKEMGLEKIVPEPSLKVTNVNSLPEETRVVVLSSRNS